MSDSESHQIEEQTIIYEQQQVLWAKIRGYPWWPAFVDKVHGANSEQEIQYTVFFFGDNTHSRLGGSKLRRFLDYYTQFFPKAKTNRKLYLSIMKAQEKLKQNGGNVQIFQKLRNSLKKTKKAKGPKGTQSKIQSEQPQHENQHIDIPQLGRHKTFPMKQQKLMKQQQSQQQQSSHEPKRRGRKSKRQNLSHQIKALLPAKIHKPQKKLQNQQSNEIEQKPNNNQQNKNNNHNEIEESQSESSVEEQKKAGYRTRLRRISRREEKIKIQQQKQQNNQESQKQQDQQQSQNQEKYQRQYPLRAKTKPIYRNLPKKRGRPKKVQEVQNSVEQSSEENDNSDNQNQQIEQKQKTIKQRQRPTGQNRKNRYQRVVKNPQINKSKEINNNKMDIQQKQEQLQHPHKQLIMERIKFCLNKKEQLIEYLDDLNITPSIIKDILDLDVTTIILEGEATVESIRVLQKLKSVLLHKYFPDDIKIRKKYQKISKKFISRSTRSQQEESLQDLELRRKTIIKLEKILRSIDSSIDQKQKAIQIESHFRKYDEAIGNGYKLMAYKVLRSLKDKTQPVQDVLSKLENGDFQDEDK